MPISVLKNPRQQNIQQRSAIVAFALLLAVSALLSGGAVSYAQEGTPPVETVAEVSELASEVAAEAAHNSSVVDHDAGGHDAGGHGAGDHELDPTHMNMTDEGESAIEWRAEKSIATLIVFGLLVATLTAVAWKPIAKGLEERERGIANNIANAERASQDAIARLADYEAKLAGANTEAQQILADARKDAEAAGQRLIATAQEEAARQRERAVAEIESAKRVALSELAEKSTDVAMLLAQRVVGREVNANDHQNLIQDMLGKLPSKN